jgi:glycosyltransferase involved in cell wall biosynthesis
MALVSVVIPTYNRFKYLLNAIQSVKEQSYKNIEIIIVNDRSTQNEYYNYNFSGCTVIHLAQNTKSIFGYACAGYVRNIGAKIAKGKYICFLDDDDYFLPCKIELQVNALEKAGGRYLMSVTEGLFGYTSYDKNKHYKMYNQEHYRNYILNKIQLEGYPDIFTLDLIKKHNCIITSSVMIDRSIFDQGIYFPEYFLGGDFPEDISMWFNILEISDCIYIKTPCIYYDGSHGDGQWY